MNSARSAGPLVLIVEDELMIAATLEFALKNRGYRILGPVATVDEALSLLTERVPDIALIDYRLAKTTTEPLLPEFVARGIPVCVLTGYSPDQLPPAYAKHTVVEKPFRLGTLMEALDDIRRT